MKYDTTKKKEKFLRKKGSIVTFKEPFYPFGTANGSRQFIIVMQLQRTKAGYVKIIGQYYDTLWYDCIDDLIASVDWEWMESAHAD